MSNGTSGRVVALCGAGLAVALAGVTLGFTVLSGWPWAELADSYGLSNLVIGVSLVPAAARARLVVPHGWARVPA